MKTFNEYCIEQELSVLNGLVLERHFWTNLLKAVTGVGKIPVGLAGAAAGTVGGIGLAAPGIVRNQFPYGDVGYWTRDHKFVEPELPGSSFTKAGKKAFSLVPKGLGLAAQGVGDIATSVWDMFKKADETGEMPSQAISQLQKTHPELASKLLRVVTRPQTWGGAAHNFQVADGS